MSGDEDDYARLMNDLDAEASDAGMGYGAETEDRSRKRRSRGGSKNKRKTKGAGESDGPSIVLVFIALVFFVAALQNWYITLPIGILCGYFFGYRAAVAGIIVATITVLLIQGETREALEAKKALQKECVTELVSNAASKHYGKPVDELNIFNRLRVNRAVKEGSLTLVKKYEEGGIQAVKVFIVDEEFVAVHSTQEFLNGMKDCTGEN